MKKHISITEFLQKLRDSHRFELLNKTIITDIQEKVTYIEPNLEVKEENENARFIIISAPGAVGKTTFAKYAALTRKGYYWDISNVKIGDNTFSGSLLKTFGPREISRVLECISKGELTLFIDSFDEAEVVSGWQGIENFLIEIEAFTKKSIIPNIVIFSRSETALEIQMKLEEIGGDKCYSLYEIDYFSEDKAISFVENRILKKGDSNHEPFREPFLRTVRTIFKTIGMGINEKAENLWEDEEIRCFIGYSPVLETIGDFLYKQNYVDIENQFLSNQNVTEGLKIIKEFIVLILQREQGKFVKGLKESIIAAPSDWNGWDNIYTPHDQIMFVLNKITKRPVDENVSSMSHIPDWLDKGFRDALHTFIVSHPFIKDNKFSSPAFRDYVLAKAICEDGFEEMCIKQINSGNFVLTSLFAFFYKDCHNNSCKANHAGFIFDSITSRSNIDGNTFYLYVKQVNEKISLEIINTSGNKTDNTLMDCIVGPNNVLTFFGKLTNASIEINSDILLGRLGGSFELHNTEIFAQRIILNVKELIVNCHDETTSVLVADEFQSLDATIKIFHKGTGKLIVNGNGTRSYPWAEYHNDYDKAALSEYKDELYILKRLLEPFRKHGRGEFAKQYEFIDNEIVKNIPERKNLLNYMIELKIIKKSGSGDKKYFLYESESVKYGINWGGLKSLNINNDLSLFFKNFRIKYPKL